jgi:hypothetical protein
VSDTSTDQRALAASGHYLLVYEFGAAANFEGQLVGALERMQATGESRIVDALFVASDRDTHEVTAIDLRSGGPVDAVARLLTFRLDPGARRQATAQALGDACSVPAELIRELGRALEPGGALMALLTRRPAWTELGDAVARTGGWILSVERVQSSSLGALAPNLRAAASGPS